MGGDQHRESPNTEAGPRSAHQRRAVAPPAPREPARAGESEPPTYPRGRTLSDSEERAAPRESMMSLQRSTQDSFNPVRVSARPTRTSLSLWISAWATVALVIVVAGSAIGIVTTLRARASGSAARNAQSDRARAATAAQSAPERGVEATEPSARLAVPAPGLAAPSPTAPIAATNRGSVSSTGAIEASSGSSTLPVPASPSAAVFRTPESLAISPPAPPSAAVAPSRRPKPIDVTTRRLVVIRPPVEESVHVPTPAPAASETPETKGESEAWVTEERRF